MRVGLNGTPRESVNAGRPARAAPGFGCCAGMPPVPRRARAHYVPCGTSRLRTRYRLASANAAKARVVFLARPR